MSNDFEVRDEIAEKAIRVLGGAIKETIPPGMGFTLFLFEYGSGGNMFYASSAKREDMVRSLVEFVEKQLHVKLIIKQKKGRKKY